MEDFLDFFKNKKNLTNLLILGILVLALPLGINLIRQQQILKSRAVADPIVFTGDNVKQDSAGVWIALKPQISVILNSPLGPAAALKTARWENSIMDLLTKRLVKTVYAQSPCQDSNGLWHDYGSSWDGPCIKTDRVRYTCSWDSLSQSSTITSQLVADSSCGGTGKICNSGDYKPFDPTDCTGRCNPPCGAGTGERQVSKCNSTGTGWDPAYGDCVPECNFKCTSNPPPPGTTCTFSQKDADGVIRCYTGTCTSSDCDFNKNCVWKSGNPTTPVPCPGGNTVTTCKGETKTWAQIDSELKVAGYPGPYDHSQAELDAYNRAACPSGTVTTCKGETKTWTQIDSELKAAGYPGPFDHSQAELDAYNRAACPGGSVITKCGDNKAWTDIDAELKAAGYPGPFDHSQKELDVYNNIRVCPSVNPSTCPADSNLTVSPNLAKVGDTMTFQYKAGEDVFIGGDTWSAGMATNCGSPATLDLSNRKYTCTAQSAVTNATWKHYWNTQQNCGSATYTITGSATPSPSPSTPAGGVRTVAFRIAENLTDLKKAQWQTYTANGMTVDHDFKTPGQKFIFVEFKDSAGNTGGCGENKDQPCQAQIKVLGGDPVIVSCSLDFQGSNTILNLKGQNFGSVKGTIKNEDTSLQVKTWKDGNIQVIWPNAPEGQTLPITLTNSDGQTVEGSCSSVLQLSVGAKVFCRQPASQDTDNVEMVLVGKFEGGKRIKQKVRIDKDGVIQGLNQKLEGGREYQLSLKAPKSLRKTSEVFTAGDSGDTNVPNFVLPVGDIFPADGGDGKINAFDHNELVRQWVIAVDMPGRSADFNQDSRVNSFDWACMRASMQSVAGGSDDPEPKPGSPPVSSTTSNPSQSGSPAESPTSSKVCAQVITPAKNPATSECKDFPTPCAVPAGWQKVTSCSTN